ncbi:2913_t:CDS:1, partial [Racocetra fulgida]
SESFDECSDGDNEKSSVAGPSKSHQEHKSDENSNNAQSEQSEQSDQDNYEINE